MNPLCPEKGCKRVMIIKEFTQYVGMNEITGKKKWGLSKYWICPVHKHQRFKVGAEVILRKSIPIEEPKKNLTTQGEEVKSKRQSRRFLIPRKIRRKIIREQSKRKEE